MSKWSDPAILRQMEELDRELRQAEKSINSRNQFDAAMAEAHKHSLSSDPAVAIPAQLMTVMVPALHKLDQAARSNDINTIVKSTRGIAMGIALMQMAATSRLPNYLMEMIDKLVEHNVNQLYDEFEKRPKDKPNDR